jgi:lysophospholipase L1-like esterase
METGNLYSEAAEKAKKIVIYGDSLSTGTHGKGGYLPALHDAFNNFQIVNYAVGSSGLSDVTPDSMMKILSEQNEADSTVEIVIIWHGTNDWYWGTPIGRKDCENTKTFFGAIRAAVTKCRMLYPYARILWALPIYRFETPDGMSEVGQAFQIKNKSGYTLTDYSEAIRLASHEYGYKVVTMNELIQIHSGNEETFLEDRVHPNEEGYKRISKVWIREIGEIL